MKKVHPVEKIGIKPPYIGVTGLISKEEVSIIFNSFTPQKTNRRIMVGVLASLKTLKGAANDKWPRRYPKAYEISEIFIKHPLAFNCIHYNTSEPETLYKQLDWITTMIAGAKLNGIQLNVQWPSPCALYDYRKEHPGISLILQIGSKAFKAISNSPKLLAEKIEGKYAKLVDYILLDASGGKGEPLDTSKMKEYLDALAQKKMSIGIGVAGGLAHQNLNLIESLIEDFPNLSVDAEGKLRDSEDNLDPKAVEQYVWSCVEMFWNAEELIRKKEVRFPSPL